MKKVYIALAISALIIFYNEGVDAYSTAIHRKITVNVIDQNTSSLNFYLNDIGLTNGIEAFVNGEKVRQWIEDASVDEDYNWNSILDPIYSHFYNPITNTSGVGGVCPSAYDWANDPNNPWSWEKARDSFYKGLTLTTKTDREKALADSFSAIGHVMHLVEDMSVPAHTRADLHASIFPASLIVGKDNYEAYTADPNNSLSYTETTFPYWNVSTSSVAPRQLWDMDSLSETAMYSDDHIGLAEYSNANFFSNGTIFSGFSFPSWGGVVEYTDSSTGKVKTYLRKTTEGEYIEHLAAARWYYKYLPTSWKRLGLKLDDAVCQDYAAKLIPRAVGYSAGLLNYFFRGQIEAVNPQLTASGTTFKIKNNTPNETMDAPGNFVVSYQYTPAGGGDSVYGVSNEVELAESISSGSESVSEYNFTFADSIPSDAQDIKYWLVFTGKLGDENDAVVGSLMTLSSWYGYYDGSTNENRYFWSSKTRSWHLVPLTALSYNEIGKRLAIGKSGTVVVAEQGTDGSQIKIAASHDYGETWQTTSISPAVGDNLPAIDVADGVFWLGVGSHQDSDQFVVFIYRSEDGISWNLTGSAAVDSAWPDDFDIAATKKEDGTTDVYVVWQAEDWKSQYVGKFANGSSYSQVYQYAPGGESIDDYARIETNGYDWFLLTTSWPDWTATILKDGAVVLSTNSPVHGDFYPWTGDIRYNNGKVAAVGAGWYTPIFALSLDGGDSWYQPGSPAGLGYYSDWFSIDILDNKIVYSVTSEDNDWNSFYWIYEGTISAGGSISWTLIDSGPAPFQYVNYPSGHIRFGQ